MASIFFRSAFKSNSSFFFFLLTEKKNPISGSDKKIIFTDFRHEMQRVAFRGGLYQGPMLRLLNLQLQRKHCM
jgi:hypothetical protein